MTNLWGNYAYYNIFVIIQDAKNIFSVVVSEGSVDSFRNASLCEAEGSDVSDYLKTSGSVSSRLRNYSIDFTKLISST